MCTLVYRLLVADLNLDIAVLAERLLSLMIVLYVAGLRVRHFH